MKAQQPLRRNPRLPRIAEGVVHIAHAVDHLVAVDMAVAIDMGDRPPGAELGFQFAGAEHGVDDAFGRRDEIRHHVDAGQEMRDGDGGKVRCRHRGRVAGQEGVGDHGRRHALGPAAGAKIGPGQAQIARGLAEREIIPAIERHDAEPGAVPDLLDGAAFMGDAADLVEFRERVVMGAVAHHPQLVIAGQIDQGAEAQRQPFQGAAQTLRHVGDVAGQDQQIVDVIGGRQPGHPLVVLVVIDMQVRDGKDAHQLRSGFGLGHPPGTVGTGFRESRRS